MLKHYTKRVVVAIKLFIKFWDNKTLLTFDNRIANLVQLLSFKDMGFWILGIALQMEVISGKPQMPRELVYQQLVPKSETFYCLSYNRSNAQGI